MGLPALTRQAASTSRLQRLPIFSLIWSIAALRARNGRMMVSGRPLSGREQRCNTRCLAGALRVHRVAVQRIERLQRVFSPTASAVLLAVRRARRMKPVVPARGRRTKPACHTAVNRKFVDFVGEFLLRAGAPRPDQPATAESVFERSGRQSREENAS